MTMFHSDVKYGNTAEGLFQMELPERQLLNLSLEKRYTQKVFVSLVSPMFVLCMI